MIFHSHLQIGMMDVKEDSLGRRGMYQVLCVYRLVIIGVVVAIRP